MREYGEALAAETARFQRYLNQHQDDFSAALFGHNTIHIPNIRDVPGTSEVRGIERYKARIFPLLSNSQYLLIPENQTADAQALAAYHREFGISTIDPERVLTISCEQQSLSQSILMSPEILSRLSALDGAWIEPFYASALLEQIGQRCQKRIRMPAPIAKHLNDKYQARQWLANLNFPVPTSHLLQQSQSDWQQQLSTIIARLAEKGHQQFSLTRTQSCAGQGLYLFKQQSEAEALIQTNLPETEAFIIEPWLDHQVASPSVQVLLNDTLEHSFILGITDQMLNERVHQGNRSPSLFVDDGEFIALIRRLMQELHHLGARGIIGMDFVITQSLEQQSYQYYVIEFNARQTGAIYGGLLATKLSRGRVRPWLCHNYAAIKPDTSVSDYVQHLEQQNIHYNPERAEGVLLVSNACFFDNKAMILCLADAPERLDELKNAAAM